MVMSERSVNLYTLFLVSFIPPKRLTSTKYTYCHRHLTTAHFESDGEESVIRILTIPQLLLVLLSEYQGPVCIFFFADSIR